MKKQLRVGWLYVQFEVADKSEPYWLIRDKDGFRNRIRFGIVEVTHPTEKYSFLWNLYFGKYLLCLGKA